MSKIINSVVSRLVNRRSYSSICANKAVNVHVLTAAGQVDSAAAAAADGGRRATMKKDVFWMRDPKTGCWIPENRFEDDVDAVELRNRLLHYK